jgi:hypothetical protein
LPFNCFGAGVASILTDSGSGTTSGSFLMQAGTYQVEFYAEPVVGNCGGVGATLDTNNLQVVWVTSGINQCGGALATGIMAAAQIMVFGSNHMLQFVQLTGGPLTFVQGATLIFTKLQ